MSDSKAKAESRLAFIEAQHPITKRLGFVVDDIRAYITELEVQVPRWISVGERLPEPMKAVLVLEKYSDCEPPCQYVAQTTSKRETPNVFDTWISVCRDGHIGRVPVTHWMPLPKPPTEETK